MLVIPQGKLISATEAMNALGLFISYERLSLAIPERRYRTGTINKPRSKNGWYQLFYDAQLNFVTIVYGNWEIRAKDKYHINLNDDNYTQLSEQERIQRREQLNAKIKAYQQREIQKKANKRNYYVRLFNSFTTCSAHDYLANKGINYTHYYNLKVDNRFNSNLLCIPFYDATGVLQGYQRITTTGVKRFCGSVDGYFWQYPSSNPAPEVFTPVNSFYILCEGLATGLSAYEAFNDFFDVQIFLPIVLCGFNAGNLSKVIQATKQNNLAYLLLVDNDNHPTINTGIETAKTIIAFYPELEIYPITFTNGDDANDFINKYGVVAFMQLVNEYAKPLINKLLK